MRLLVGLLLAAALAAPAAAAPRVHRLADGPPIVTDGKRFAVELRAGSPLVVDTRGGSRFEVERPEPGCTVATVGSEHLLWECARENHQATPRMFDLAARREVRMGGREQYERFADASGTNGQGITQLDLGAHWMVGVAEPCYHCEYFFALNWRTGETRDSLGGPRDVEDLDSRRGYRRACAPARRVERRSDYAADPPWSPLEAAGDWFIDRRGLRRCGSRRVIRVRGRSALTTRHAVFLHGRTLTVRHLASGRVHRRRLPAMRDPTNAWFEHTHDRAYVNDGGDDRVRRWRVRFR